jgi:hypothetical protein
MPRRDYTTYKVQFAECTHAFSHHKEGSVSRKTKEGLENMENSKSYRKFTNVYRKLLFITYTSQEMADKRARSLCTKKKGKLFAVLIVYHRWQQWKRVQRRTY